jgi:hypothetical protein
MSGGAAGSADEETDGAALAEAVALGEAAAIGAALGSPLPSAKRAGTTSVAAPGSVE